MRLSYLWLKDFVDFKLSPSELAELLTMAGLEVENVAPVGPELEGLIVGQVLEVRQHPNADKLTLCRVDLGDRSLEVVCGAPNVAAGQKVVFIEAGQSLPDGTLIEARPIRGVRSEGMICSERELGLSDKAEGIMVLNPSAKVGTALRDYLGTRDWALDLEVTINRPDCLSHLGIAREISAALRKPLRLPAPIVQETGPPIESLTTIEIFEPSYCPRYSARIIQGVKIAPSPNWLRWRLEAAGLRAINNVVDVTNYVLLELGHPLHAFDYNLLEGKRIQVRCARPGERFITLDEQERILDDRMLLICDGARGVALAGVMGGQNSEITPSTTDLLLESAYFDPVNTRRTSRLLNLSTDSSRRFERGADPEATILALDRAAELIVQVAGGEVAQGVADVYPQPRLPNTITLRPRRVQDLLGIKIPKTEIYRYLEALECSYLVLDHLKCLEVQPPTFRPDLEREIDLIEEIARLHGYDQIPTAHEAKIPLNVRHVSSDAFSKRVGDLLVRLGFTQVLTSSLLSAHETSFPDYPPAARLKNAASDDAAFLRNGLLPGLLKAAAYNLNRDTFNLRLTEVGRVFWSLDQGVEEEDAVAGVLAGSHDPLRWDTPQEAVNFLDLKGIVEDMLVEILLDKYHFSYYDIKWAGAEALAVYSQERRLGFLGRVHPQAARSFEIETPIFAFEFKLKELQALSSDRLVYHPLSKFPALQRDLAFTVAEAIPAGEMLQAMLAAGGSPLVSCELFDVYRSEQLGQGVKSAAFRLKFQSFEGTLTDAEAEALIQEIIQSLKLKFNAKLRA